MQDKVWRFMEEHHMVEDGDRIIIGVSGGADSVALFYLLKAYRTRKDFRLSVVHVNHNLRGEEAMRDQKFVEELCQREGIFCKVYAIDTRQIAAKRGLGVEEAGRQGRMEAFAEYMESWQGTKIALAHHGNDLAETVLHHLARGTGLTGLRGIAPVQGEKIRPLLCLERREIEQYLKERKILYVTDSTNLHGEYTRNRIRNNVIPLMEQQINSRTVPHMMETADQLYRADCYLKKQAEQWLKLYTTVEGTVVHIDEIFFGGESILCEYGLLLLVERAAGTRRDLACRHVEEAMRLIDREVGKVVELPGAFCFEKRYGEVILRPKQASAPEAVCTQEARAIAPEESVRFGRGIFTMNIFPYSGQEIPEKTYTKWLNYDKIDSVLWLRNRKPGDYLVINHSGGRKKLKDYFIDCKIPRQERDATVLLAAGSEILWVVGYRINEAYKVDDSTRNILEITYEGGEYNGREDQCDDQ